ncbi:SET domain-containing protein [Fomes fomentarius]|nr:SET domain-containing protein [Fomes fomentarius]
MDDLEQHQWERLLRWLGEEHGMDVGEDSFHVTAREVPGAGRGLFAVRDCPPSTALFKVPATALITKETLLKLYPQLRGQTISGVQLVSLHLWLHRPVGDADSLDPTFGPYISTLPRESSSHPLSWMVRRRMGREDDWEDQILKALPPGTHRRLHALHDRFWTDWASVSRTLIERPTIVDTSSRTDLTSGSCNAEGLDNALDYLWAWLNVNTRCIFYRIRPALSDPDNFALCPILDFANHSPGQTHIFPVIDSEVWAVISKKSPKNFIFFGPSSTSVSSGQELYLQYGAHPNSFLFSEYGFVNRIPDGAIIAGEYSGEVDVQDPVEELVAKSPLGPRFKSILEAKGYWGDWTLHSAPSPAHPSYRLIAALRLLSALESVPATQGSTFHAAVNRWRDVTNGQYEGISAENEEKWRQILHSICSQIVERARRRIRVGGKDGDSVGWRGWTVRNVETLWKEELEVAEAVAASILANVEF